MLTMPRNDWSENSVFSYTSKTAKIIWFLVVLYRAVDVDVKSNQINFISGDKAHSTQTQMPRP